MTITITRDEEYGRRLIVDDPEWKHGPKMTLLVQYTGDADTYKAVKLDGEIMPLLAAASEMAEALRDIYLDLEAAREGRGDLEDMLAHAENEAHAILDRLPKPTE